MEVLFSFLGGATFAAVIALIIARGIVRSRITQAEESAQIKTESFYKSEQARMDSDLRHARERCNELLAQIEAAKADTQKQLQAAKENAKRFGFDAQMEFFLSDGASAIPRDFDVMVCAGMGADTMIAILEAAPWLRQSKYRLILQCQSKTPALRQYLSETGWRIYEEAVLKDGKFLYTVMEAGWRPEYPKLTPGEWYFPPALLENPSTDVPAYYRWVKEGLKIAVAHRGDNEPLLKAALEELTALAKQEELTWLED